MELGKITTKVLALLKPVCCPNCNERFPDDTSCRIHMASVHEPGNRLVRQNYDAKKLTLNELRNELQTRGLSATGRKDQLIKRLTGALALERH